MRVNKLREVLALSILLCATTLGAGVGDVELVAGSNNQVWLCGPTTISVYFKNDAPLYGFSLGFDLSAVESNFHFVQPFGTLPSTSPVILVEPVVDPDFEINVDVSQLPDRIFITGSTLDYPLPPVPGPANMLVFRFQVYFKSQEVFPAELCIDNIVHPVSLKWMFFDVAEYAPTYRGLSNNSMSDPSAAPECFDIIVLPSTPPYYTSTPPTTVTIPFCETYSFDFDGDHLDPMFNVHFDAAIGLINPATGFYQLPPDGGVASVVDTIGLYSDFNCNPEPFIFTINRTNAPPEVNNCRPILYVQQGTAKMVDYDVDDGDTCDSHNWGLSLLSGTPPAFPISIDQGTGALSVDATAVVTEETFAYQIVSTDLHGGEGSCLIQLQTISGVAGDADNSGTITVSDAVYLINYIFSGGPQPISMYRADPDCSGATTVSDVVYLINYIFGGGLAPCGVEP